jgi:hypothetical protein
LLPAPLTPPCACPRVRRAAAAGHLLRSGRALQVRGVTGCEARESVCVWSGDGPAPGGGGGGPQEQPAAAAGAAGPEGEGLGGEPLAWEADGEPAGVGVGTITLAPGAILLAV